jgi:hypothetical protein
MNKIRVPSILSLALVSLILSLVSSVAIKAQEEAKSGGSAQKTEMSPRKIVAIKYADVNQLASILTPLGFVTFNRDMKVITLGGSPEAIAAMEDAIKRLDVPPPPVENIELTAYLLVASEQSGAKNTSAELDGVIKQLKGVFPYQGYRLLDTLMVRCRNGREGEANGMAPSNPGDVNKTIYQFRFRSVTLIPDSTGKRIRVDGLRLGAKMPVRTSSDNYTYIDTGINTDLDVREGQKIVVGKATVDSSNNALFLVLTARVVD